MEFDELLARLHDPDQWVRVEALRILAMVEETRALKEIEVVYRHDPEPGVRQVAQWAGRILYAAVRQSKVDTQSATPVNTASDREEALLSSLVEKDQLTYTMMQEQLLQRQLNDNLRPSTNSSRATSAPPPTPEQPPRQIIPADEPFDPLRLLDDGLSEDFFKP